MIGASGLRVPKESALHKLRHLQTAVRNSHAEGMLRQYGPRFANAGAYFVHITKCFLDLVANPQIA